MSEHLHPDDVQAFNDEQIYVPIVFGSIGSIVWLLHALYQIFF